MQTHGQQSGTRAWSVQKESVELDEMSKKETRSRGHREEDEDKKPPRMLNSTWFAQFEKELKKSGGKYKDVDPTDMLKTILQGH